MNLIVNKSENAPTAQVLAHMLQNSPPTDTHLLLAYGYFYYDDDLAQMIVDWMQKSSERVVIFIAGIHGRHELSAYETARMKRSDEPSLKESTTQQVVNALVRYAKRFPFSTADDLDRWKAAAIYRFHAKICALMSLSNPALGYDDLYEVADVDPDGDGPFHVTEFIMGSTNFTDAGMSENIELDMHVPRNAVTAPMVEQINNLVSVAAKALAANKLSDQVTREIGKQITELPYRK